MKPGLLGLLLFTCGWSVAAQDGQLEPPLVQSPSSERGDDPLSLEDAARDDRWLGVPPSSVSWSPDSRTLYFRFHQSPTPEDDPEADPWFAYDSTTGRIGRLEDAQAWTVPSPSVSWSHDGEQAVWTRNGRLVVFDAGREGHERTWIAADLATPAVAPRMAADGSSVQVMLGENLFEVRLDPCEPGRPACARWQQLTQKRGVDEPKSDAARWLEAQQLELFELARERERHEEARRLRDRTRPHTCVHELRVAEGLVIDSLQRSPDGDLLTVRASRPARAATAVLSYVNRGGYSEVEQARSKVGEPQTESRLGFVALRDDDGPVCESVVSFDTPNKEESDSADAELPRVAWWKLPQEPERPATPHGPFWSRDGRRALAQFISADHQDLWIVELDSGSREVRPLVHDHDDAWLGGPPIQANYWSPALVEWLDDGSFVFASERTGWSHLYRHSGDGRVEALTDGPWEVRSATLSLDRQRWLLEASREHPSDDHLYTLPATGGELRRLTEGEGRHNGWLSPDGRRLALLTSDTVTQPDLYVAETGPSFRGGRPGDLERGARRLTRTGTDNYWKHGLVRPEIVAIEHPDGRPVYAALYRPEKPHPKRPAVLHIHGGGYRQFSHRGWSVYGFESHVGLIQHLVQKGYTVLDFDYRGSSGYGRDYRTDIYKAMGHKDVDGAVAAIDWLAENEGVDPQRVGVYGISYGGFFTLMAQFRHPGRFAAGVAIASVTDWAHYNHPWTSRVLGLPYEDPEAYERSSPIEHAEGLADPLLIVHGLLDENVQYQDVARLSRKLIELEKDFELMAYPAERHVITDEASRLDFTKRLTEFFATHLLDD